MAFEETDEFAEQILLLIFRDFKNHTEKSDERRMNSAKTDGEETGFKKGAEITAAARGFEVTC